MISRREWVRLSLGTGAALVLPGCAGRNMAAEATAAAPGGATPSTATKLITRAIHSTGEQIPVVGLGSSATL